MLQPLSTGHAAAVLRFEVENRAHFARSINDRGDEFFARFDDDFAARLAEQRAGEAAYHVLIEPDGSVTGRINLYLDGAGSAALGYRIAEHATGRGVATAGVIELCVVAADRYDLRRITAAVSHANIPSQRVLIKADFVCVGPADPREIGGKTGDRYERMLTAP